MDCDYCGKPAVAAILDHVTGGRIDYCPDHDPANTPGADSVDVRFKSAASGLLYSKPDAAGDIDAVIVDGVTYRPEEPKP